MSLTILEVCAKYRISPDTFFSVFRDGRVAKARRDVIYALHARGLSASSIARIIRRDPTTVWYWLDDEKREKRREAGRRRNKARRERQKAQATP